MELQSNGESSMSAVRREQILAELDQLPLDRQRRVLEFARALALVKPVGVPGKDLVRFAGSIPKKDLQQMKAAIEEACERIDRDGW
jgi:hypothetical protein